MTPTDEAVRYKRYEAVALAVVTFALVLAFLSQSPLIYDNDSYYHLAVARMFAEVGLIDSLPAVRASAMSEGFGDKELGFHVLLIPFVVLFEPLLGGRVALATLITWILTTCALLARPTLGRWAYVIPVALPWLSPEVAWRLVRLRAELLAVALLLLSLAIAVRQRERWLTPLAFLFTISYTAFHAYLGLFGLIFLWRWWVRREFRLQLVLYPTLGSAIALVLHPHFPDNLRIWILQSFDFFQGRALLDVGTEVQPNLTSTVLLVNLGAFLLLAALLLARASVGTLTESSPNEESRHTRAMDVWGIATVVFTLLYLLMSRFSLYVFPFALFWVLATVRRGGGLVSWCRLPGARRVPLVAMIAVAFLVAAPEAIRQIQTYHQRNAPGPDDARIRDREQLAAALPSGAHVAARWQQTPLYMYWAPQARYLNVLDPIFMARPYPREYDIHRVIFEGEEPDVPLRLVADLDSRYIAFSRAAPVGNLFARLQGDPRAVPRHLGSNALFEIVGLQPNPFVTDWQGRGSSANRAGVLPEATRRALAAYVPLASVPRTNEVESRSGRQCASRNTVVQLERATTFEFAPWSEATLRQNGKLLVHVGGRPQAVLGHGVQFELPAGEHALEVHTCQLAEDEPNGFYLLRR